MQRHSLKLKVTGIILLSAIGLRLYLPTLVKKYLNGQLNKDPTYRGRVADVELHLWRGAYTLSDLLIERVHGQRSYPFVKAERTEIGVAWKELLHRSVVAEVNVEGLVLNVVAESSASADGAKVAIGAGSKQHKRAEAQNWHTVFKNFVPLEFSILHIEGTSLHFRDLTKHPEVNIYLDNLKVDGENLTNNRQAGKGLFGTLHIRARAMKSGSLDMVILLNPIVSPAKFKFTLKLNDLNLVDLNPFFTAYAKFDVKKGRFSLYAEGASADDKIVGYAKPTIQNLVVSDFSRDVEKGGVLHALWEQIVGTIGSIFKNFPKDRQAARIPFSGKFNAVSFDTWATIESILENMFVKPITANRDAAIQLKDVKKVK